MFLFVSFNTRRKLLPPSLLFFTLKPISILVEKPIILLHIVQLPPLFHLGGSGIQIEYPRPVQGEHKRGMCGYDKLTIQTIGQCMNVNGQFLLERRGHRIFRLVQEIEVVRKQSVLEKGQGGFTVRLFVVLSNSLFFTTLWNELFAVAAPFS